MKNLLRRPMVNAACISLFSVFYAVLFFASSAQNYFAPLAGGSVSGIFWPAWAAFLAAGHQRHVALALLAITALIVILLMRRHKQYDEYHTTILTTCLTIALTLTLIAIALFYWLCMADPQDFLPKFTLFITIHWVTVVLADLGYVLLCKLR